jgi:hypothetical protein
MVEMNFDNWVNAVRNWFPAQQALCGTNRTLRRAAFLLYDSGLITLEAEVAILAKIPDECGF